MSEETAELARRLADLPVTGSLTGLVLGASDTGKTTLVETLAGKLAEAGPVAVVDADIGQSHIGPPATVGWAMAGKGGAGLSAKRGFSTGLRPSPDACCALKGLVRRNKRGDKRV